jgi:hypothetical protein
MNPKMFAISETAAFRTLRQLRTVAALLLCLTCAQFAAIARQSDVSADAVNKAHAFFRTPKRGQEILNYVHMYAAYRGHDYVRTVALENGQFELIYRFRWEDDGVTDIAFLCNAQGSFDRLQITYTNAGFNQPFFFADATIQVLGRALIEAYKDKMSESDLRFVRRLIDRADAKGMLEFTLKLEQALGR